MGIKSQKRRNKQYELSISMSKMWTQKNITMSMKEYTGEGHMCPECGEEMKREIDSMVCRSIDKTGDFYRSFN